MEYKTKIIKGKVQNTGYPIDGHVLTFSQLECDRRESWYLWDWDQSDDNAVMETMYRAEQDAGLQNCETLAEFEQAWRAGTWSSPGAFVLPTDQVEVLETVKGEGITPAVSIRPRKLHDRGGIICLPLDKNLNGNTQAKHPDWNPISCPKCGRKCWKMPEAEKLQREQDVSILCTECAVAVGMLAPYRSSSKPNPDGNRTQRRARRNNNVKKN